ncbi:MAG: hypothetical protein M5R36_18790 [Deltaproteobacteria bacterium]|nr:hypothetical protein [Deltaproteobacteria bacterium]
MVASVEPYGATTIFGEPTFTCYMRTELIIDGMIYIDWWDCLRTFREMQAKLDPDWIQENISEDPRFLGVGNDHLSPESMCIDAGRTSEEMEASIPGSVGDAAFDIWLPDGLDLETLLAYDADGDPRPYGAGWDIGPDEWTPQ